MSVLSRSSFAMRPGQALAYFYFEGRAQPAISGQAAHPRRGPPHGGELRQAARAAAAEGRLKASTWPVDFMRNVASLVGHPS